VPAAGARSGWRTRVMLFAEGFPNAHVRLSQLPLGSSRARPKLASWEGWRNGC
jgi:hypothetical protein